MLKTNIYSLREEKKNKKGVHSKNKNSISKASKFYKKKYRGQGKKR
jgi:hypothetical protein